MELLGQLLRELRRFVEPLDDAFASQEGLEQFLRRFGLDPTAVNAQSVLSASAPLVTALTELASELDELETVEGVDPTSPEQLDEADLLRLGDAVRRVFEGLRALPALLVGGASPPQLFSEVWDALLAEYLFERSQTLFRILTLLGVVEMDRLLPGLHPDARALPYVRARIHPGRLATFLRDPAALMSTVYGWGTNDFDADLLLVRLADVFDGFGAATTLRDLDDVLQSRFMPPAAPPPAPIGVELPLAQTDADEEEEVAEFGLLALPIKGAATDDTGIGLMPYVKGLLFGQVPLSDDDSLTLHVQAEAGVAGAAVFAVRPSGFDTEAGIDQLAGSGSFSVDLRKTPVAGQDTLTLLGDSEGTRLEASSLVFSVGGDVTTSLDGDFFVSVGAGAMTLVVDPSEDGLLGALLSDPIEATAGDLLVGWRPGRGIYFERSSSLGLRLPLDRTVGSVLRLRELGLGLLLDDSSGFEVDVSGNLTLGPLVLGVERLGIQLRFPKDSDGLFGKYGLDAGLKLPSGYQAALNGGPFRGGGLLSIQDHEYRGMLALEFEGFGLAAFGILTTRMPSGASGFSFLASLFGEVDIQLGFGFRLTGIGGLIGLNRTTDVDELRDVLTSGRLDSLLFPREPLQDAAVILADMASVFPARDGQHLFGPMGKIAWGTPALIEGKLGIILELGDEHRLVILGNIASFLPSRDAAIVAFNFDFLGTVEFSTGSIDFRGSLRNSRILNWPVSGEAAVQTGWGASAGLVASVGGLHPSFPRPPGFPALKRLTINFATDNPSLTLEAYVAVTLNSIQAGADASLYKRGPKIIFVGRFEVEGWVGFDAIVTFDPFSFDVALRLGLRLLLDGDVLCGINGDLRLSGPNNYVIQGKVSIKVCGVRVSVGVNHSWGDKLPEPVKTVSGLELLRRALATGEGLEPVASSTLQTGVAYAPENASAAAVRRLDPSGGLRFVQRALPLATKLDHVGSSRLSDGLTVFDLEVRDHNDVMFQANPEQGNFAAGVFFDLTEAEKLEGDPFVEAKAGISLHAADVLEFDAAVAENIDDDFETVFMGATPKNGVVIGGVVRADAAWARYAAGATAPLNPGYVSAVQTRNAVSIEANDFVSVAGISAQGVTPASSGGSEVRSRSAVALRREHPGARIAGGHFTPAGGAG